MYSAPKELERVTDVFMPTYPQLSCVLYQLQSAIQVVADAVLRCSSPGDWRWMPEPTSLRRPPTMTAV